MMGFKMKKNEFIELANAFIDGELDETRKEKLLSEIKINPEAKKYYDDLVTVTSMLRNDSKNEKEIDLTYSVINKLDKNKYSQLPQKASFWDYFNFANSNNFRYAAVFSIGILVGLIVYTTAFKSSEELSKLNSVDVYGTMTDISKPINFSRSGSVNIDNSGVKAKIDSYFQNDLIITEVKVKSDDNISLNFSFNDSNLKVYGMKSVNTKAESNIISGKGIIQISSKGENTFIMMFKNRGSQKESLDINVYSGISMIFNSKILAN